VELVHSACLVVRTLINLTYKSNRKIAGYLLVTWWFRNFMIVILVIGVGDLIKN